VRRLFTLAALVCALLTMGAAQSGTGPANPKNSNASAYAAIAKKAEAARAADKVEEAIRLYKQLVAMKPALVHLRRANDLKIPDQQSFYEVSKYHLALLFIRHGDFELATQVISEFAHRGADSVQFREAMGLAALRKPLLPNEIQPAEREMVLDAGTAVCDSQARRADKLQNDATALLSKYPTVPEVHYIVGLMFLNSDADKALDLWKQELRVSPGNLRALVSIVGEYLKRSDFQSAQQFAEQAVNSNSDHYASHAVLGQVLSDGNLDVGRGIKELELAERMAPWQAEIRFSLAKAYAKAGRKEDATRERAEFMKLSGNSSGVKPN